MKLNKSDVIAGVPVSHVRAVLRYAYRWHGEISSRGIRFVLKDQYDPQQLSDELIARDLLTSEQDPHKGRYFRLTTQGSAFALASFGKGFHRRTAAKALEAFLERVNEVNRSSDLLCSVERVRVFESYLSDAAIVHDIDLAVQIEHKIKAPEKFENAAKIKTKRAIERGRKFSTFLEELFWPEEEVRLFLKHRSPILSIHEGDQPERINATAIEIFPTNRLNASANQYCVKRAHAD